MLSSTARVTSAATTHFGLYPAALKEGSVARAAYGAAHVEERHRHRYEVNNTYREQLEARRSGSSWGTSPDNNLVEFVELPAQRTPLRRQQGSTRTPSCARRPDPAAPSGPPD